LPDKSSALFDIGRLKKNRGRFFNDDAFPLILTFSRREKEQPLNVLAQRD
jgi:hypothetical protein